jgi:two-component system cell cycle sensor histidine kinase/response regulator CckA
MPGINGRTLAERATAILPKMRVLFVSGYTDNVIAKQGVLSDGVEFLAKPYSAEQLGRRVREVIEKGTLGATAALARSRPATG